MLNFIKQGYFCDFLQKNVYFNTTKTSFSHPENTPYKNNTRELSTRGEFTRFFTKKPIIQG